MRRKRACFLLLIGIILASCLYLLISLKAQHADLDDRVQYSNLRLALPGGEENYKKCPIDREFVASVFNATYGHPVLRKDRQIMYISVPKCGSRTMVWLAWIMKEPRNISDIIDLPYLVSENEKKVNSLMSNKLQSIPLGGFFHGHIRYFDTNEPNPPIFVSMLRDPLSRHVSWYYFMRYGDSDIDAKQLQMQAFNGLNDTYDECIQKRKASCCSNIHLNLNILMFCGYGPKCGNNPKETLEQAKRNLDKFLFVGIMEEYVDSLRVMERLLPGTFQGVTQEYFSHKVEFSAMSKTSFKKAPKPETVKVAKELLKYDYEFYNYAKERFHKLKRHYGIGSCD